MATTRRAYTGGAQSTTTASAIASSGTTSFTITAYTGWPYGSDPFFVVVEPGTASEEKILVTRTGSTDTTINIASDSERAQDGTSAVAHSSGSVVFPVFTALDADEANELTSSWSTKGDLVSYGSSTFETLGVGADDTVLVADSGETSGLKWSSSLDLSGLAVDTDTLYVDATNNRVGVNDATPSYALDVDGDINATGDLRIGGTAIGEYTTFTTVATNITISSQDCFYAKVNEIVVAHYYVEFGGAASGTIYLSLPVAMTGYSNGVRGGVFPPGLAADTNTGGTYTVFPCRDLSVSNRIRFFSQDYGSAFSDADTNSPFTWASGDTLRCSITYMAA